VPAIRLQTNALRRSASRATSLLRVLANENRLLLLCQLAQGQKCVGELEKLLDIRQPTLSQQLGVLRSRGLVSTRRNGKHIYYRVRRGEALDVLHALYAVYCGRFKRA